MRHASRLALVVALLGGAAIAQPLDSDGDGLPDALELYGPRPTDPLNPDTDGDGLLDGEEDLDADGFLDPDETDPTRADTDGGGTPDGQERRDGTNPRLAFDDLDADPDLDQLSTREELLLGTNPNRADTDGDGLPDGLEVGRAGDLDPTTRTLPTVADTDGDGLSDGQEDANRNGAVDGRETDPNVADSDGGGTPDGRELADGTNPLDPRDDLDADPDGDGLTSREERALGTSPVSRDTDQDGIPDGIEVGRAGDADPLTRTSPTQRDTDGDGLDDGVEDRNRNGRVDPGETDPLRADTDGGGTPDGQELLDGTDPLVPFDDLEADVDRDGLSGRVERALGTNPRDADTDGDGLGDAVEAAGPTDPLNPDTDGDGLLDGEEDTNGNGRRDPGETDPLRRDTDGGGTPDGQERRDGTNPLDHQDDLERDHDLDGLTSREELAFGLDPRDADTDDDGLIDGAELDWNRDTDGDGLINALDPDSDNDGLPDGLESGVAQPHRDTALGRGRFVADADPATRTDPLRADTDGGGVPDGAEDLNRDGAVSFGETDPNDPADDLGPLDSDRDGLPDLVEVAFGLDPFDADTDDDGVPDGAEPNFNVDHDLDGLINALDPDSDDDGLPDGLEMGVTLRHRDTDPEAGHFIADADPETTTSPLLADTDRGGLADGLEDRDRNGRVDDGETDPRDPADDHLQDTDGDGLPDDVELWAGTDPEDADSDDDGVPDGLDGLGDSDGDGRIDALDPDSDNDGILDGTERGVVEPLPDTNRAAGRFVPDLDPATRTDPRNPDTDRDGIPDGVEDRNRNGRLDPGETDPTKPDFAPDAGAPDAGGDAAVAAPDAGADGAPADPPDARVEMRDQGLEDQPDGAHPGPPPLALHVHGGGGCRSVPGGAGALVWLLALLGLVRRWRGAALALLLAALPGRADAYDANRFVPRVGTDGLIAAEGAQAADHLTSRFGILLHHADDALVATDAEGRVVSRLAGKSTRVNLTAAVAFVDRLEVGVDVPVVLSAAGARLDGEPFQGLGIGDLRVVLKGTALRRAGDGVSLGLGLPVTVPVGNPDRWQGDANATVTPTFLLDAAAGRTLFVANVGYRFRAAEQIADLQVDDEVVYDVGVRVDLPAGLGLLAELSGSTAAADAFVERSSPLDFLGGLQFHRDCLTALLGGGGGIVSGAGSADWRLIGGFAYSCPAPAAPPPAPLDADADGVADEHDRCPGLAEDVDGFDDHDGCPDADNDGDGLADADDGCPDAPEDHDGFQDEDGCPDPDNDGDGVPDVDDRCPLEAGPGQPDGCPLPDRDGDGIADALDACPDAPEDFDGVEDADGCPDPDLPTRVGQAELVGDLILLDTRLAFRDVDTLTPEARATLTDVAALLARRPDLRRIRIEGHTDSVGPDALNLARSQRKAEAVRRFLVELGVGPGRLRAVGEGERMPIDSNARADGREANNRIEFHVEW